MGGQESFFHHPGQHPQVLNLDTELGTIWKHLSRRRGCWLFEVLCLGEPSELPSSPSSPSHTAPPLNVRPDACFFPAFRPETAPARRNGVRQGALLTARAVHMGSDHRMATLHFDLERRSRREVLRRQGRQAEHCRRSRWCEARPSCARKVKTHCQVPLQVNISVTSRLV